MRWFWGGGVIRSGYGRWGEKPEGILTPVEFIPIWLRRFEQNVALVWKFVYLASVKSSCFHDTTEYDVLHWEEGDNFDLTEYGWHNKHEVTSILSRFRFKFKAIADCQWTKDSERVSCSARDCFNAWMLCTEHYMAYAETSSATFKWVVLSITAFMNLADLMSSQVQLKDRDVIPRPKPPYSRYFTICHENIQPQDWERRPSEGCQRLNIRILSLPVPLQCWRGG